MAKIGPLTPQQARRTLAHRFTGLGDRLRQLNTKFGVRPYRCWLVWARWSGSERGEGTETIVREVEVLPTPYVEGFDGIAFSPYNGGTVEVGTVRVSQISAGRYSEDMLVGRHPEVSREGGPAVSTPAFRRFPSGVVDVERLEPGVDELEDLFDFWWELREDGRGDDPPMRKRYRPANVPTRRAGKLDWTITLESASEDRSRDGDVEPGLDPDEEPEG